MATFMWYFSFIISLKSLKYRNFDGFVNKVDVYISSDDTTVECI